MSSGGTNDRKGRGRVLLECLSFPWWYLEAARNRAPGIAHSIPCLLSVDAQVWLLDLRRLVDKARLSETLVKLRVHNYRYTR